MNIVVNGNSQVIKESGTLGVLLKELGMIPERVAVMVNGRIVRKDSRDSTVLKDGDHVEILTFMGGG